MGLSSNDIASFLSDSSGNNFIPNKDQSTNGFSVPATPSGNGFGLPSSQVPYNLQSRGKRSLVHWFVPEVGIVDMYINPQSINYKYDKIIIKERTKGGYVNQYWGEELLVLQIQGTTGSSGIEGINVLKEVYRSEQLTFDPVGLTVASTNLVNGLADAVDDGSILGSIAAGILDIDPLAQSMLPRNLPSLASLAFGVEMYWMGQVFRGYFTSFSFDERADSLGLFYYNMTFTVTQTRGYRYNYLPWHHSAVSGPSNHDAIPYTFEDTNARGGAIDTRLQNQNALGLAGSNNILNG